MSHRPTPPLVRAIVLATALAELLFWLGVTSGPRGGPMLFDFIFIWLVIPSLVFCALEQEIPLGAGLAAAAFVLNLGLSLRLAAQ
ncbi:hypothetical protein [Methylocystis sp. ATCC 49242]|uniref:hypothetical protein n=1 Tax=Methylocystis sp. ATCC 49242 TaxID=622637 RepID=UPI0001F86AB9|nr:hypothetical protein [Methylocystis sp. ATCC 49242]